MLKLKELYYDPNENTSSANRLYEAAKRNKIDVTMKEVQAFIKNQAAYQKTKTFKKQQRLFSSIMAPRLGSNLQIDFMYSRGQIQVSRKCPRDRYHMPRGERLDGANQCCTRFSYRHYSYSTQLLLETGEDAKASGKAKDTPCEA